MTKDGWKLIFEWSGATWLYDRNTDPLERNNVYAPDHPRALELWGMALFAKYSEYGKHDQKPRQTMKPRTMKP